MIGRRAESGFTLLELLVVVGVMGLLGTVATTGYYAAVNGMEVRGAKESVASLVQAAQQRAATDHVPTGVCFYNQLLREGAVSHNAVVVGVAVAVRAGGRLSGVVKSGGTFLVDEFADLERGRDWYGEGVMDSSKRQDLNNTSANMKLWRMDMLSGSLEYSEVYDYVTWLQGEVEADETFATVGGSTQSGNSRYNKVVSFAFEIDPQRSNTADSKWKVGDLYAQEIAVLQLPHNMIFGSGAGDIPKNFNDAVKENPVNPIFFNMNGDKAKGSTEVQMATCRTKGADGSLQVVSKFNSDKVDTNY